MSLREISPKKGCLAALLLGLGHDKKKKKKQTPASSLFLGDAVGGS